MYDEPEHAKHSELIYFHRYGLGDVDSDALYQTALRDYAYRKKYGFETQSINFSSYSSSSETRN
jgi:hypothetical protein